MDVNLPSGPDCKDDPFCLKTTIQDFKTVHLGRLIFLRVEFVRKVSEE